MLWIGISVHPEPRIGIRAFKAERVMEIPISGPRRVRRFGGRLGRLLLATDPRR